jgi:hypothetical protein
VHAPRIIEGEFYFGVQQPGQSKLDKWNAPWALGDAYAFEQEQQ